MMQFHPYQVPTATELTWWDYFQDHRDRVMDPQLRGWTCSACSLDWVLLATNLDPHSTREKVVGEIGYPNCINEEYGLLNTNCLVRVLESHGVEAKQQWLDFDTAYALAGETTGVLNSTQWYHFVAIRGQQGDTIWIANSSRGYRQVDENISRAQWNAWAGSWQAVTIVR